MRQNLEELRSTQEEAQRQHDQVSGMIEAFGKLVMWTDYDAKGNAIGASDSLLAHLSLTHEKLIGVSLAKEFADNGYSIEEFNQLWTSVKAGSSRTVVMKRKVGNETRTFEEVFTPVYEGSNLLKVLKVSHDITAYCMA